MGDDADIMRYAKKKTGEVTQKAQEHKDIILETASDVRAEASHPSLSVQPKHRGNPSTELQMASHLYQALRSWLHLQKLGFES
jgi:hypothetical protein